MEPIRENCRPLEGRSITFYTNELLCLSSDIMMWNILHYFIQGMKWCGIFYIISSKGWNGVEYSTSNLSSSLRVNICQTIEVSFFSPNCTGYTEVSSNILKMYGKSMFFIHWKQWTEQLAYIDTKANNNLNSMMRREVVYIDLRW